MRLPVRGVVPVLLVAAGWLCGACRGADAPAAGPGCTDVTEASGIGALVRDGYAREPKWWLSGLNLVDLDGDGRLDLFLASHGAGTALVGLGDGQGHFSLAPGSYPKSEIHIPYDINEDGRADLQMTRGDGGGQWWLNDSRPGHLSFRETAITCDQGRQNALVDLNRDGKVDWLHERPGIAFELGDGMGGFKKAGSLEVAPTRFEINVYPADLDGDGFIDLAVQWGRYEATAGKSRVYRNAGKMDFADGTSAAGLTEDGLAINGVGDVNRDGAPDLVVLEHLKPAIYLNDGKGRFSKKPGAITGMEAASKPAYASWGLAVVTDLDNDGTADLLWNGRHFLWALRGTGGGDFTYMDRAWGIEDKSAASVDDGLCFGDIDGDGDLDLVGYTGSLSAQRGVRVYRNDLPARHWLKIRLQGAPGNRGAAGAKIRIRARDGAPLWQEQVMILSSQSAHNYYAYAETERHFGLGDHSRVDVSVEFYPSGKKVERQAVPADTTVTLQE